MPLNKETKSHFIFKLQYKINPRRLENVTIFELVLILFSLYFRVSQKETVKVDLIIWKNW